MSSDEEAFRTLLTELRLLEGTAETLQNRIGLVNASITELAFASATIEGLKNEEKGTSMLVAIGGGSFVKAEVVTTDTIVVGVGAGVSVEKPRGETKKIVDKRIAELEKSKSNLQQQLSQVLSRMRENRQQLDETSRRLAEGRLTGDFRKTEDRT